MDEKFEEVVELVREGVESAGLGLWRGEREGKWLESLIAGCERDVLEVTETVCDLCPAKSQSMGRGDQSATTAWAEKALKL